MSVHKTAAGTWQARYRDASGREHTRTHKRKDAAVKWETEQRAGVARGDWIDPRGARTLFKTYAQLWIELAHVRPKTLARRESALRVHILPTFGHRRLGAVRRSEVKAWVSNLDLEPSTVKVVHGILASVFHSAVVDKLIPVSPCENIPLPRINRPPLKVLSFDDIEAVTARMPDQLQTAVTVAAGTGLRQSELLGLTVDHVDFLRRTVTVTRQLVTKNPVEFGPPKTDAGYRTIPTADVVLMELARHIERYGTGAEGLVFSARDRMGVHRFMLQRHFSTAVVEAGIPEWATWNDLRHFYASLLIHQGCSVKQVQTMLGHESAKVTLDTYAGLWPASDDQAREAVQAVFGRAEDSRRFRVSE